MSKIQRALLSVSDKAGLAPLAQTLAHAGVELVSTGGTAKVYCAEWSLDERQYSSIRVKAMAMLLPPRASMRSP